MKDQSEAHSIAIDRAHFRIFAAGHAHTPLVDKFSALDSHHEDGPNHDPDESWEAWEAHLANEMDVALGGHHNVWHDKYHRANTLNWRGYPENGYATEIGGLHDGQY